MSRKFFPDHIFANNKDSIQIRSLFLIHKCTKSVQRNNVKSKGFYGPNPIPLAFKPYLKNHKSFSKHMNSFHNLTPKSLRLEHQHLS